MCGGVFRSQHTAINVCGGRVSDLGQEAHSNLLLEVALALDAVLGPQLLPLLLTNMTIKSN